MTTRRALTAAAILVVLLVILPAFAAALFLASLDPNQVKARAEDEVQHATGRQFAIGTLHLRLLPDLVPDLALDASDIALANPAGFSRPALLTAARLRARIALLPLLHHQIVIRELTLDNADLKLEASPSGQLNWHVDPAIPSASLPREPAAPQAAPHPHARKLTVLGLEITNAAISWQLPAANGTAALTHAQLREVNASSTISLTAKAVLAGEAIALDGKFGGQDHLWTAADHSPWPLALHLTAPDGSITVTGTLTQPRILAGADLTIAAHGPDLAQLATPWPDIHLPRLRDVTLATHLLDQPDGMDITRLALTAGPSDLSATTPGLALTELSIAAPNLDGGNANQPNTIAADGTYAGAPLHVAATLGPIGRLFGHGNGLAHRPITLDATATASGANLAISGQIAPYGDWSGTNATLHASIPDLAALSALAARPLPRLHAITLAATISTTQGLLSLTNAHLAFPQADLTAAAQARLADRPSITGTIHITRLDLDALHVALPVPAAPPPTASTPLQANQPAIPATPPPATRLPNADADIILIADQLHWRGVSFTTAQAHLSLTKGKLTIDPATATLSGTPVHASASLDTTHTPQALALHLHTTALSAGTLSALLGAPGTATGLLDTDLALTATGATPHAIAATLDGHAGVALTNGSITNALLIAAVSRLTQLSGLHLPTGGGSDVACLAARLDIHQGVANLAAFLLDSKRLRLAATGSIDLGAETLDLRLRPYLRLGSSGLVLPSRATGSWQKPKLSLEPAGLANDPALMLADTGDCAPALAAARSTDSTAPPMPAATPAAKPSRRQRAINLLRKLFK